VAVVDCKMRQTLAVYASAVEGVILGLLSKTPRIVTCSSSALDHITAEFRHVAEHSRSQSRR
jgi:hypothetical protein